MKKLAYLFVMIAGMTLAAVNVNAQDAKAKAAAKETTAACCKAGDKMAAGKCCMKDATSACANKDAGMTSQKMNDKKGACCMTKTEPTASNAKGTKVTK